MQTFGRLLGDRSFIVPATSFSLACAVLFAYIAGSSFVLEDVYGVSPQAFSLVFAVNSAGLIGDVAAGRPARGARRPGGAAALRAVRRRGRVRSPRCVVTIAHAGLAPLLISLFVIVSFDGLVFPNATAVSLERQDRALGSASALLGMGQFGTGALIAPLVGVAGSHDVLPMAVLIGACGLAALAVNLVFSGSPRTAAAAGTEAV